MSSFLDPNMNIWRGHIRKDDSVVLKETVFKYLEVQRWDIVVRHLWGRSGFLNCSDSTSNSDCPNNLAYSCEDMYEYFDFDNNPGGGGGPILYKIQGITKDSAGNPLGECIIDLFRTLDDLKVDSVISDSNGNYLLYTPYLTDQHYCVAYKGSNLAGATVNSLLGVA